MAVFYGGLSLKIEDEVGESRSINLPVQLTFTDPADIDPAVGAFVTALDAPLWGKVIEARLNLEVDLTSATVKAAAQVGSNVRSGATMSLVDSAGNRNPVFIPSMANDKFVSGSNVLNDGDAEVSALKNALINNPIVTSGTATIEFMDEDDRKYESYARGFRTTRKM